MKADGSVVAWGSNDNGELDVPSGLTGTIGIAAGSHNLALKSDGAVVAWGLNSHGQATVPLNLPATIAIAAGSLRSLAIVRDASAIPTLSIRRSNGEILISWPAAANWKLEMSQTVAAADWTPAPTPPTLDEDTYVFRLATADGEAMFFRLRHD
jgi:hypothetical protein